MPSSIRHAAAIVLLAVAGGAAGSMLGLHAEEGGAKARVLTVELAVYDVRDFTNVPTDFPAPQDGGAQGPFNAETPAPALSAADLAALVHDRMLPTEFADPTTSIEESGGKLIVMQTRETHAKIEKLLQGLRAQMRRRISVQALEVAVDPERALDWLGKAGKPLAKDKVEDLLKKDSGATLVSAPQFVAFNKQRGHLLAGRFQTYVADADVAGEVLDPVVKTRLEGVVLDARPVLDAGGSKVNLELRYNRQTPAAKPEQVAVGISLLHYEPRDTKQNPPKEVAAATPEAPKNGAAEKEPAEEKKGGPNAAAAALGLRPVGDHKVTLELPRTSERTIQSNLKIALATWVLVGVLDPVPNAAEGSVEAKSILFFVRCENVNELPNTQ
ncbi:MAG: hypothetical protein HY291_09105 [Planctomycetes bacterium]|nr:hypothetical protein [Planctomycetota bacterium]